MFWYCYAIQEFNFGKTKLYAFLNAVCILEEFGPRAVLFFRNTRWIGDTALPVETKRPQNYVLWSRRSKICTTRHQTPRPSGHPVWKGWRLKWNYMACIEQSFELLICCSKSEIDALIQRHSLSGCNAIIQDWRFPLITAHANPSREIGLVCRFAGISESYVLLAPSS